MIHFKVFTSILVFTLFSTVTFAEQTNVSNLPDSTSKEADYTFDTFFSTRVVNGQSTEGITQHRLDFRVEHRFGLIKDGYSQFFGLDQAYTFISFEYGIKDWWMVGINRSSTDKTVEALTKLSLFRQSTGAINVPLSVSLLLETSVIGTIYSDPVRNNDFASRESYISQLLFARKFSDNFSAQISPIWIHRSIIPSTADRKDLFAFGICGRYKLTPTVSFNGEYYPVINPSEFQKQNYKNSLSFSIDLLKGGHVFQFVLSNSTDMIEKNFIGETNSDWLKGELHLGFNILRKFDL